MRPTTEDKEVIEIAADCNIFAIAFIFLAALFISPKFDAFSAIGFTIPLFTKSAIECIKPLKLGIAAFIFFMGESVKNPSCVNGTITPPRTLSAGANS